MKTEFLISTNGDQSTWPAIEYGTWAAALLGGPVTLLGVAEHLPSAPIDDKYPLEEIFARAVEGFEEKGISYTLQVENGDAEEIIPREVKKKDCIAVIGPLGRPPLRRFLAGRSIRHLMAEISAPILYVPQIRLPLRKMLVCIGGLGYEITAENLAVQLAAASQAEVKMLHVSPPVDLNYPAARLEGKYWRDLINTNTLPGRNLRRAVETARQAGLVTSVVARQGNVVEEILGEMRDGNYDLVCLGSSYSAHGLRQMYTLDVTGEVAGSVSCPIVTARYRPENPA